MRVGLVCPYSWDVPGGVKEHVRDLAEELLRLGHEVSVLAPGDPDAVVEPYVVLSGRAVPVPFNGSVARLSFGPVSASRTRRWIREGGFDLLHVHEPVSPSVSMLAVWAASGPVVGTFHSSYLSRSRVYGASYGILQPTLERITARIAVSEAARSTVVQHVGGDAVLIPNGVALRRYAKADPMPGWPGQGGALGFLGRIDEPRKGLPVLLEALRAVVAEHPGVRLLVAGPGDVDEVRDSIDPDLRDRVELLGLVSDADKAAMLHSVDLYVAPNTGGESFGMILLEAMAAGAPVLASNLDAFRSVLDDGRAGRLFPVGDPGALAAAANELLRDRAKRTALAEAGTAVARRYDWQTVAQQVLAVYETVILPGIPVGVDPRAQAFGLFSTRLKDANG
ncbi:MAG TPA: glycosyltransferase family 4 protein [Actinomycetes bacterium]